MAVKKVEVAGIGHVSIYKRKGVHSVRLSIAHNGDIRVTLPSWAPYRLGMEFVRSKSEWIISQSKPKEPIRHGDQVGKAHRFVFMESEKARVPTSRLVGTDIRLLLPKRLNYDDDSVQRTARSAAIRALKKEAEQLLPQKLEMLALQHGFSYRSVQIKQLKSRWGSCNEHTDITLNCFLMQLPWHLIEYVLLHELTHTKVMAHGHPFWSELAKHVEGLRDIRKEIKTYQPTLVTIAPESIDKVPEAVDIQVSIA